MFRRYLRLAVLSMKLN